MLSLTREEALEFVENRLATKDAEKLFVKDRFLLLNDLIVAFHNNIPFQTLTNLAVRPDIRHIPDFDEMKDDLFSGKGGKCIFVPLLSSMVCFELKVLFMIVIFHGF